MPALVPLGRARDRIHYDTAGPPAACGCLSGRCSSSRDLLKRCDFIFSTAFCKMRKEGFEAASSPSSGKVLASLSVWSPPRHLFDVCSPGFSQENAIPGIRRLGRELPSPDCGRCLGTFKPCWLQIPGSSLTDTSTQISAKIRRKHNFQYRLNPQMERIRFRQRQLY